MRIPQRWCALRGALAIGSALAVSVPAATATAASINVGPSDVGTRTIMGQAPASLSHGALALLDLLSDSPDQKSVDSIIEFDITPLKSVPQGVVIESATLILNIAGAQTLAVPADVSVNGYADGDGVVGLGDFAKTTTLLGTTGNLADASPGTVAIPFQFDITSFIQTLADHGTMRFVGFHLEGPGGDSQAWAWGNAAPAPDERPELAITYATVPEPPGALLVGLGLAGVSVLAYRGGTAGRT